MVSQNQAVRASSAELVHMETANTLRPEDILTPEELAQRLKVSIDWVYEKSRARGRHGGRPLPCFAGRALFAFLLAGGVCMDAKVEMNKCP